ncbi:MAG: tRNA (adenosine(37)-N6)-dimethylallyltransferase MiaA [Bacteroidetes bacterium]|nr:tRNA (adenosine(37)-N6)-dimethylallyltransferase MiaA [Bacteroidota bacterium]
MNSQRPQITILTGPTASGKTAVSLALAERLGAEIISADSRQVYRGLDIGTAKPEPQELAAVPHHGIDICDPSDTYTVGRFYSDAQRWINEIHARGRGVLVVGGSGLYVRAVTDGIFDGPIADQVLRAGLEERIRRDGLSALVDELRRLDPDTAAVIDAQNPVRVVRALEVCLLTGRPYSALRSERMPTLPYDCRMFGLRWERSELNARIDRRVDAMVDAGLVEEVRGLVEAGADPAWTSLNTVGYKEVIAYLSGLVSIEQTIEAIKRSTRQYARRQLTWFRKEGRMQWLDVNESDTPAAIAERISELDQ